MGTTGQPGHRHEQKPRRRMPTDCHTRKQPTTPTLTTSDTREICRTCADRAPKSTSDTPGRSDYRSPSRDQSSSRRHLRCQTEISAPEKAASANYAAKMPQTTRRRCRNPHGEDAAIPQSPSRCRLRDDAPKEEKDAKTPPSPDPADLRFLSGAKAVGRSRSTSTMTLPRKIATPAGAAVAGSGEDRSKDFSRRCADHLPPPPATH